jgi:hypothetical protein
MEAGADRVLDLHAEMRRIRDITCSDLLRVVQGDRPPSVSLYFTQFDATVALIAHSILASGTDGTQCYAKWLSVLAEALSEQLTNYQLAIEIWTAISARPIDQIAREAIAKGCVAPQGLPEIADPTGGYGNVYAAMAKMTPAKAP